MDDDVIDLRNAYYVNDDEWRNGGGGTRNRRVIVRGGGGGRGPWGREDGGAPSRQVVAQVPAYQPAPYYAPSPVGRMFNMPAPVLIDAAAQLLAALSALPAQPSVVNTADASKDAYANLANLIEYQRALASYAKRNEQIRTAGALAKLLMA